MLLALLSFLLSVLYFYFRVLQSFMLAVLFFMTLSNKNTPYSVKEEIYQHFPIPNICEKNPQYTEFHKRDTIRSNTTDYNQHNNIEKF